MAESNVKTGPINPENTGSLGVDPKKLLNWVIKETTNVTYNNQSVDLQENVDDSKITRLVNLTPEEREKWMTALFGKKEDRISDIDRLKLCISSLLNDMQAEQSKKLSESQVEELLQNMHFLCEIPDVAQNLIKLSGLDVIWFYAKHGKEAIREHAAWILHTASGNNVVFKQRFLQANGMEGVFNLIASENNTVVLKKLLGILTNMIRQFQPGMEKFVALGGVDIIVKWIKESTPHVYLRSLRTLLELINSSVVRRSTMENIGLVQILQDGLQSDKADVREIIVEIIRLLCMKGFQNLVKNSQIPVLLPEVTSDGVFEDEEYRSEIEGMIKEIQQVLNKS